MDNNVISFEENKAELEQKKRDEEIENLIEHALTLVKNARKSKS